LFRVSWGQEPIQDVNFTAGKRWAGGERLPLGRPGEDPQGFGMQTGLPSWVRSCEKARRTRAGVIENAGEAEEGASRVRAGCARILKAQGVALGYGSPPFQG